MAFTAEEFKEFDRLTDMASSRNQVTRIDGRLQLNAFVKEHGKEKCDEMWFAIESLGLKP